MFIRNKRKLKFDHINCQSLNKKRDTLKKLLDDLGEKLYGITETWLGEFGKAKFWEIKKNFKFFRSDWKADFKERCGGVKFAVPK